MEFTGSAFSVQSKAVSVRTPKRGHQGRKIKKKQRENRPVFEEKTFFETATKNTNVFRFFSGSKIFSARTALQGGPRAENEKQSLRFWRKHIFCNCDEKIKKIRCFSIFLGSNIIVGWAPEFI